MVSMRRRLRGFAAKASAPSETGPPEAAVLPDEVVPAEAVALPEEPAAEIHEPAEPAVDDNVGVPTLLDPPHEVTGPVPDAVCAAAVDLARAVAVEAGGSSVGDHLGLEADDDLVVTHSFATTDPAYVGWRWAVTVARADGTDEVTVDEVVLLPGSGALVAPAWVPWSERVKPEDLSPGDLLPPAPDDPRLVPSYAEPEAELAAETFWELGLGRPRVLSADGRLDAADRWYYGDQGPDTPMARQAPAPCLTCAFRLPLAGGLTSLFGVCANGFAPDDGKVVSLDHGCGAHSETPQTLLHVGGPGMVVEDEELEIVAVGPTPDDETPDGHAS